MVSKPSSSGVMQSNFFVLVSIWPAKFCTTFSLWMFSLEVPEHTVEQWLAQHHSETCLRSSATWLRHESMSFDANEKYILVLSNYIDGTRDTDQPIVGWDFSILFDICRICPLEFVIAFRLEK